MEQELEQICTYLTERVTETVRYYAEQGTRIEEIRLRRGGILSFTVSGKTITTRAVLSPKEFETIFLNLSQRSLYSHAETMRAGFLQVTGGYRVGVCGSAVLEQGAIRNLAAVTSMNIRIPYRPRGISASICRSLLQMGRPGTLIFSPPGGGKTTLLADIAATLSAEPHWLRLAVVDSRGELCLGEVGNHTLDVLRGYPRGAGIEIATRTLSPEYILCDEIGTETEAQAMQNAMYAGVPILATTHASSIRELFEKNWVRDMHTHKIFRCYIEITRQGEKFCYRLLDAGHPAMAEVAG